MKLPKPKTQKQRILLDLIRSTSGITEEDRGWHAFRHYISELRKSILIKHINVKFESEFGNVSIYRRHWLTSFEKRKAIKLYLSLVKKAA